MTCPVCGKAAPCAHERERAAAFIEENTFPDDQTLAAAAAMVVANSDASAAHGPHAEAGTAWRQEIASRVEQHRARRRRPNDPKALELDFSGDTPHSFGALAHDQLPPPPPRFAQILVDQKQMQAELARPEPKIIRFPRTQPTYVPTVEEVTLEELERAAPLPETPRILDVGETFLPDTAEGIAFAESMIAEPRAEHVTDEQQVTYASETFASETFEPAPAYVYPVKATSLEGKQMDFLSSFEDIRLAPAEEVHSDDAMEVIPQPAPLLRRFVSGAVDAGIVFAAVGVFVLTVVIAAGEMPQSRLALICMVLIAVILWMLFQYAFLTFRRTTPGMEMAQLELCTFAGTKPTLLEKQRRVLASALSTFSMGLGYVWALVDEDRVAWHDRISQTHMRQAISTQPSAFSPEGYFGWKHLWRLFQESRSAARDPYEFDDLKN